jgi:hypothetical protein
MEQILSSEYEPYVLNQMKKEDDIFKRVVELFDQIKTAFKVWIILQYLHSSSACSSIRDFPKPRFLLCSKKEIKLASNDSEEIKI